MEIETTVRVANSHRTLDQLLDAILARKAEKPDWIHLQGACRIDRLPPGELRSLVRRLHKCVLRGFRARNVRPRGPQKRLEFWRTVARNGFHDFSEFGWMKCYDSPFVESYDYIGPYLRGGVAALDPYRIYSAVLGTHDYSVEDFICTSLCEKVETIIEPMAGTGDFAYAGHFHYPGFRCLMLDLDQQARKHVLARRWLENTDYHYEIADVLDEATWKRARQLTSGRSLSYIGKQSHHLFDAKQLFQLLAAGTRYVDYFILETPEMALVSDMAGIDELTRPEMKDAGFEVALREEPGGEPNPFTNKMGFRLDVWDKRRQRTLFRYPDWTNWTQPTLVAMAKLLDLNALYYHSELHEFVSVDEHVEDSDCLENVTFMLFTRHGDIA
jgi:hypothetical protein